MMYPTFRLGDGGWPGPGAGAVAAALVSLDQILALCFQIRKPCP